jgi:phage-related protein
MPIELDLENKLNLETGCQIPLFEVKIPGASENKIVRACVNNEDVLWGGYTWKAIPIKLGEVEKDTSQIPSFDLKLNNIDRILESYFNEADGGVGAEVTIRLIRVKGRNTDGVIELETYPVFVEPFDIQVSSIDDFWVTLKCGFDWSTNTRRPQDMWKMDHCDKCRNYPNNPTCGVAPDIALIYPDCDGTWLSCKARNNTLRFGGVPTIGKRQSG